MDLEWYNQLNEWFPDRDQAFVPIWGGSWSDYSGAGWMVILDKDGQLYELSWSYSPEADNDTAEWNPWPITYEQAIKLLEEWEDLLD